MMFSEISKIVVIFPLPAARSDLTIPVTVTYICAQAGASRAFPEPVGETARGTAEFTRHIGAQDDAQDDAEDDADPVECIECIECSGESGG